MLDIFNENRVRALEAENSRLMRRLIEIEKEEPSTHKMGVWCNGCRHMVTDLGGLVPMKYCLLDCPCQDREGELK